MSQLHLLIKEGDKTAKKIKEIVENIDNYLWATQLGVVACGILLWWIWEPLLGAQINSLLIRVWLPLPEIAIQIIAIVILFTIIIILEVVLGEQVPKIISINNPLRVAKLTIYPIYWFYILFTPLISIINFFTQQTLKLLRINRNNKSEYHTEEELRMIVAESKEEWLINVTEETLIQKVFDYDETQVNAIMTPINQMFAIDKADRSNDIIKTILSEWYSRIPIFEGSKNNILWRVLLKDIVELHVTNQTLNLDKLLRPILVVPNTMKINTCLKLLQREHTHIAIVVSEYGTTMGLISMEDILEELVWEINDENDEEINFVKKINTGQFLIDTTANIQDINESLPHPLPESSNYETIAWYLYSIFWHIPAVGDTYTTSQYIITIKKRNNQRIEQALFVVRDKDTQTKSLQWK